MKPDHLAGILQFLREAERLKQTWRSAWTSGGHKESTAAHTWRLCLMALLLEKEFPEVNFTRLLKICIVHDLGEAIRGDIPAIHQKPGEPKGTAERRDLLKLVTPLPETLRAEIVALWDEYEAAATPEARIAKALDKLETILQHNQGANPPDFDYAFNLPYGKKQTDAVPLAAGIRRILDEDTRRNDAAPKSRNT